MAKSTQLELTVIHVTNEEQEAMMVADRIAVINKGKLIQVGSPHEIYYQPKNLFVANFMSEINYFEGVCIKDKKPNWDIYKKSKRGDKFFEEIYEQSMPIVIDIGEPHLFASYAEKARCERIETNIEVILVVRSNHLKIRLGNRVDRKSNSFLGKIQRRKFMGVFYRFEVLIELKGKNKMVIVTIPATSEIHEKFIEDSEVTIYFPKELGIIFKHPGNDVIEEVLKLQ